MGDHRCIKVYATIILWWAFFIGIYLFVDFIYKAVNESFDTEDIPQPSDDLRRPVIIAIFSLTFLSIGTYAIFLLGIQKLSTRLMLPWAFVIGFKCITGGILLIYASAYVSSTTLLQGIVFYSATIISFIGIYYCYLRVVAVKKTVEDRTPIIDNLSIITLTNEKPKTIV